MSELTGGVTRRGFLLSCLALGAAPAIVRADSLMRIVPRGLMVETTRTETALWTDPLETYWRMTDNGVYICRGDALPGGDQSDWNVGPLQINIPSIEGFFGVKQLVVMP